MFLLCQNVHRLELRKSFILWAGHLPDKREVRKKFKSMSNIQNNIISHSYILYMMSFSKIYQIISMKKVEYANV